MNKFIYILFFLLGLCAIGNAQKITNKGTEFWAGFGHAAEMETTAWLDTPRVSIAFSAEQAAKVVVTLDGTTYRKEYLVPANTVIRSDNLPQGTRDKPAQAWDAMLYTRTSNWPGGTNSEGIFKGKGIHIQSDVPIVAYEIEYAPASAAATMLIPVDSWGYSYKILSHDQTVNEFEKQARFAWVFVVANYDNTQIEINPTNNTRSGLPAGVPISVNLQKGEIYQLMADVPASNLRGTNDLIGTTVKSVANSAGVCYPVATFVGSSGAYISCTPAPVPGPGPRIVAEDMAIQQMFPVQAWGRRYITTPGSASSDPLTHNYNIFRVMPKIPGTVVKRNGIVLTNLTKGYYEFLTNTSDYVEADNPIQVVQIFPSQSQCNYIGLGDPEMVFLSPIEQGIKKVVFQRLAFPGQEGQGLTVDWNFLTLNISTKGLASLTIDGLKNNWDLAYPNANLPGYSVVVRRWNTRSNTDARAPAQCTVESDSSFNAITYGLSAALSYSYNVGTYIDNLSGTPFIKNRYNTSDTASTHTCAKTPVELSVLIRYQPSKILWKLSDLAGTISPATDIIDNVPVQTGQVLVNGVIYYKFKLPGTYQFNKPGTFKVPVYSTASGVEQCDNTELIPYEVLVNDTLQTGFDILYANCNATELVKFGAKGKFNDSSLIQKWQWNFMNGTTPGSVTGKDASFNFDAGTNSAELIAIDGSGCIADTTRMFTLVSKPQTPDFSITGICEKNTTAFAETKPLLGAQSWYWDFGDGDVINETNNGNNVSHTYKNYQTVTVKHVVKASETCKSDTATKTIVIYAKPALAFTYSKGCLPENGVVAFTSSVTTADNQAIASYLWNFGDASATPANPNTATSANTSHTYAAGNYPVKFTAVSEKGCASDSAFTASFNPRAQITYGASFGDVCVNAPAPVFIGTATVANPGTGEGYYKGPGIDGNGYFHPDIAKEGSQTLWYVYDSKNGCIDSVSSKIFVHSLPVASFTAPSDICLDKLATFADNSTINTTLDPAASVTSRIWNFGDGGPDVKYLNGNPFDKQFTVSKIYNVTLRTISSFGCEGATVTKPVNVHPLPAVSFDLPAVVCMPGGETQFTNTSTLAESQPPVYNWQFGDGGVSTLKDPVHTFATAQSYTVVLKAVSSFGCEASANKIIGIGLFKNNPVAAFDISDNKPCEGTAINFTDKSTSATGTTLAAWNWTFGDNTISSAQSPSKKYDKFGSYIATLTVKDNNGCVSAASVNTNVVVRIKPVIDAGPDLFADETTTVTLKATASNADQLSFKWSPASVLNNASILNPSYIAVQDQVFVLTATDKDGICTSTDQMKVAVLRPVKIPNVFSPNGDGINDVWNISNLAEYAQCSVTVFNRYGQKVYFSQGYTRPWDGTMNGSPLPVGTYYYVITTKAGVPALTGSVTILR